MNDREQRKPGGAARNAFTLVEAIFVIVILGILSAIAMPHYAGFIANQQLEAAARRVQADLSLARWRSRVSTTHQTVSFDTATNSYTLLGVQHPDHSSAVYRISLSDDPYHATIVSADFGGDAEIIFDGWGAPDGGGSVVVQVGSRQKRIDVDPNTGQASIP